MMQWTSFGVRDLELIMRKQDNFKNTEEIPTNAPNCLDYGH